MAIVWSPPAPRLAAGRTDDDAGMVLAAAEDGLFRQNKGPKHRPIEITA